MCHAIRTITVITTLGLLAAASQAFPQADPTPEARTRATPMVAGVVKWEGRARSNRQLRIGPDRGLANVVVFVRNVPNLKWPTPDGPASNSLVPWQPAPGETWRPDPVHAEEFRRRICPVRVGQPLHIHNGKGTHHLHLRTRLNGERSRRVTDRGLWEIPPLTRPEIGTALIKDAIHPWIITYVPVFDHPFFAVTGIDGRFELPAGLPEGVYELVAWHEKYEDATTRIDIKDGVATSDVTFRFNGRKENAGVHTAKTQRDKSLQEKRPAKHDPEHLHGEVLIRGPRPHPTPWLTITGDRVGEAVVFIADGLPDAEFGPTQVTRRLCLNILQAPRTHPQVDRMQPGDRHPDVFDRKITAVQTGTRLEVWPRDNTHTIHFRSRRNGQWSRTLGRGGVIKLTSAFTRPELGIRIGCDCCPWMDGRVAVFDHRRFATTDRDGRFKLPTAGLPEGSYAVHAWHPALGTLRDTLVIRNGRPTGDLRFTFVRTRANQRARLPR